MSVLILTPRLAEARQRARSSFPDAEWEHVVLDWPPTLRRERIK